MIMPEAGRTVTKRVDFKIPFDGVPVVTVNANSSTPNNVDVTAGDVDALGFTVFLYRSISVNTHVAWMAAL